MTSHTTNDVELRSSNGSHIENRSGMNATTCSVNFMCLTIVVMLANKIRS